MLIVKRESAGLYEFGIADSEPVVRIARMASLRGTGRHHQDKENR
jgi:hypothetical protein